MKKMLLLLVLLLTIAPFAVQAQTIDTCTPDVLAQVATDINAQFEAYGATLAIPEAPAAADFARAALAADEFAVGYWQNIEETYTEPLCVEAQWVLFQGGLFLDSNTITLALNALAVYDADAGNLDTAQELLTLAQTRNEGVTADSEGLNGLLEAIVTSSEMVFMLPECTQDELDATFAGIETLSGTYGELGSMMMEDDGTNLPTLVTGFASLSQGYWTEIYPLLPGCIEAEQLSLGFGQILDESLLAVAFLQLSQVEGDSELAQTLSENGFAHVETLMGLIESFMMENQPDE